MRHAQTLRIAALLLLSSVPLRGGESLLKNGSFEQVDDKGHPAHWIDLSKPESPGRFARANDHATDGAWALRVTNPSEEARPHVFSQLAQVVALKADTHYTLAFRARGGEARKLTWVIGKSWNRRIPVRGLTAEWKEFRVNFALSADELDGGKRSTLRLISEDRADDVWIDDVRLFAEEPTLVHNGAFAGAAGTVPDGWEFRANGGAQCTGRLDGQGRFVFVNASQKAPNVYGMLRQDLALRPGGTYILKFRLQGQGAGLGIALGKRWADRYATGPATPEGRQVAITLKVPNDPLDNGLIPLVILCETPTEGAAGMAISELSIEPPSVASAPPEDWQRQGLYGLREIPAKMAWTTLRDIPATLVPLAIPLSARHASDGVMPGPADFSAKVALARDGRGGLFFFAKVVDATPNVAAGGDLWRGDCVQVRFDRVGERRPRAADGDLEIGLALDAEGRGLNWCWDAGADPWAGAPLPPELLTLRGARDKDGYFIAAHLDRRLFERGVVQDGDGGGFAFTVAVNDSARPGHRAVYFLTPGLHDVKDSSRYLRAIAQTDKATFRAAPSGGYDSRVLRGELISTGLDGPQRFVVAYTDRHGAARRGELAVVAQARRDAIQAVPFAIPLAELADGPYTLRFSSNGAPVAVLDGVKRDAHKEQREAVAAQRAELSRLEQAFRELLGDQKPSPYVAAPLAILGDHLPRMDARLAAAADDGEKRYYAELSAMTAPEIAEAFADLRDLLARMRAGRRLPATWTYRSSPVRLVDGWPVATAENEAGRKEERPVAFAGYGHFGDVVRDLDKFANNGVNLIQIEIGPRHVFPREGREREFEADFTALDERILAAMRKALDNDVQIALLISPHYYPAWMAEKYPEANAPPPASGFLKYEVTHPKAVEMMKAYIAAVIPRLKDSPWAGAIHSVCVSNEPVYYTCRPENPRARARFAEYMEKEYGAVAAFNAAAGRDYQDFAALAAAAAGAGSQGDPVARHAFYAYAKKTFADWHAMLGAEVKKHWPEMPVHSKIMVFSSAFEPHSGVDPEQFAAWSDYNGNDNYFFRRGRWAADWPLTALTHEIQLAAKPVSIANTENHIIPDREIDPVPNSHIRTAVFQQFVTGASALATWVYADADYAFYRRNPKDDLLGNIHLRPGNMIAHATAALDAMRLAPELKRFLDHRPEAALLYSPTAILRGGDYRARLTELYTALCFSGHRPGLLTERQLAEDRFGAVKLLFVVGAPNVDRAALAGLGRFAAAGGRILADAASLKEDELGRPAALDFPVQPLSGATTASPAALARILSESVAPPPFRLEVAHENGCEGVFFRTVPDGRGGYLVNLVNYNNDERHLRLDGEGSWFDLLRDESFEPAFTLPPLKPLLLRFTPRRPEER